MTSPEAEKTTDAAVEFLEHNRKINRKFHDTDETAAYVLDVNMTEQLKELGLLRTRNIVHVVEEETEYSDAEEHTERFEYLDPKAVRVIIDAFMTGKMPQPEGKGSFFFSERTALGRQSALDTALERIKSHDPYDVAKDKDFFPETGAANG